jgi:hypothetical protein
LRPSLSQNQSPLKFKDQKKEELFVVIMNADSKSGAGEFGKLFKIKICSV